MLFPTVQFAISFPDRPDDLLGVDAQTAALEAVRPCPPATSSTPPPAGTLSLLAAVTVANQAAAVLVHRTDDQRRRRVIVAVAIGCDLGVLGLFKYYSFFAQQWANTLSGVGLAPGLPLLTIALPVGISFFTFQAISYVVDVKRRMLTPAPAASTSRSTCPSFLISSPARSCARVPAALKSPRDPNRVAVSLVVVDRAGLGEEGRDRRLSGARLGGTGVRGAARLRSPGRRPRRIWFCGGDLLRLLRLH